MVPGRDARPAPWKNGLPSRAKASLAPPRRKCPRHKNEPNLFLSEKSIFLATWVDERATQVVQNYPLVSPMGFLGKRTERRLVQQRLRERGDQDPDGDRQDLWLDFPPILGFEAHKYICIGQHWARVGWCLVPRTTSPTWARPRPPARTRSRPPWNRAGGWGNLPWRGATRWTFWKHSARKY